MRPSSASTLTCAAGHRWDLLTHWPLPEAGGQLVCPACRAVLSATVAVRPDQAEDRAYRRSQWIPLLVLVAGILAFVLMMVCKARETQVCQLAYAPDGMTLAVGATTLDATGEVRLLDAATGRVCVSWPLGNKLPSNSLHRGAFAPDGRTLAVAVCEVERPGQQDARCVGVIVLWDMSQGKERARLHGHTALVAAVAFAGDGRTLLSADTDGTVVVWDCIMARPMGSLQLGGVCACLAVSPDGRRLAAGLVDGTVALVDLGTGRELGRLAASAYPIASVAFAPDGKMLAMAGVFDTHLLVWEPAAGKVSARPLPASWQTSVAFSPDGQLVAVGGGSFGRPGQMTVFRSDTLEELRAFSVHTNTVTALAFAPDGSTLAAGSGRSARWFQGPRHGAVHRWDLATGRLLPADE